MRAAAASSARLGQPVAEAELLVPARAAPCCGQAPHDRRVDERGAADARAPAGWASSRARRRPACPGCGRAVAIDAPAETPSVSESTPRPLFEHDRRARPTRRGRAPPRRRRRREPTMTKSASSSGQPGARAVDEAAASRRASARSAAAASARRRRAAPASPRRRAAACRSASFRNIAAMRTM